MSFFESDYTPTDADLQDWIHVLKLNEAEDFAQEPGEEELDINFWIEVEKEEGRDAIRKRTSPTSYPSHLDQPK